MRILLVEDEAEMAAALAQALKGYDMVVDHVPNLAEAEEATRHGDRASTVRDWEAANRRFHRLILSPCRMPRLLRTIDDLQAASARFLFAAWQRDWEARTDHDHRAILDALRKGQTDLACAILSRHVGWIGKRKPATKNAAPQVTYEIPG